MPPRQSHMIDRIDDVMTSHHEDDMKRASRLYNDANLNGAMHDAWLFSLFENRDAYTWLVDEDDARMEMLFVASGGMHKNYTPFNAFKLLFGDSID